MEEELIAPCGMNCGICSGYLAGRNDVKSKGIVMSSCSGCRPRNKQCAFLKKECGQLLDGKAQFCYECEQFPCSQLLGLDKKYRALYRMSMVENLEFIREHGVSEFLIQQREKWKCPECGGVICCHNGICFSCGLSKLDTLKNKYRWEDGQ